MNTTNVAATPKRVEEERARRRRREDVGFSRNRNLAIEGDLDPRYEYRWINDDPGRVHNLTVRDDWDLVASDALGARHEKDKGVGTSVERIVGKSDGRKAVLVRKLKDYYHADKLKEQSRIDETDAAIKRGATPNPSQEQRAEQGSMYVPAGGISIQDGRKG